MSGSRICNSGESLNVVAPIAEEQWEEKPVSRPIPLRQRLRGCLRYVLVRQITLLSIIALHVACWIGRRRRPITGGGCEIMLTGRFDSDNWILAHLGPLSASKKCSRIWMVSTNPVPELPKVEPIYPPKWLIKTMGLIPARFLTFARMVFRKRPHVVGGFDIMANGIAAVIVGRLLGARSMYFCVGGPAEVCGGGIHVETTDTVVENRLLRVVAASDIVITMGTRAVRFFRDKGINTDFYVVSGGIDPIRFQPSVETPSYDLVLTGRLVEVKRIDVFLQAVRNIVDEIPDIKAVIVGNGKLRDELEKLSSALGIDRNVSFVGHQNDVENWLRKSRIFVLTSDSEGLSLSMMEAMMCGLPAIVSNVGDLGDLVDDGINGYLVPRRSPDLFADRIVELLSDVQKLKAFSRAAHRSALRYTTEAATAKWDNIIEHSWTS